MLLVPRACISWAVLFVFLGGGGCQPRVNKGKSATQQGQEVQDVVTSDLEGQPEPMEALINGGVLQIRDDGLDFGPNAQEKRLVFVGDFQSRGSWAVRHRKWLLDLKTRYPERIVLILGNWEANPLSFLQWEPALKGGQVPRYEAWLAERFQNENGKAMPPEARSTFDVPLRRFRFWYESKGLAHGGLAHVLEFHRKELEEIRNTDVTSDEADADYLQRIQPGGEYFSFLRAAEIAHLKNNTLYVHGGVNSSNLGVSIRNESGSRVLAGPGPATRIAWQSWVDTLNKEKNEELDKLEAYVSSGKGDITSVLLPRYLDANWDAATQSLRANEQSVVYAVRSKDGTNVRLPEKEVRQAFVTAGLCLEVVGHTPVGTGSVFLRSKEGYARLHVDTSFTKVRASAHTRVKTQSCEVEADGITHDGIPWSYKTSPTDAQSPVGMLLGGKLVVSNNLGGKGPGQDLLVRWYEGFSLNEVVLNEEAVKMTSGGLVHPEVNFSTELDAERKVITDGLSRKAKVISIGQGQFDSLAGGRVPLVMLGGSKNQWLQMSGQPDGDRLKASLNSMLSESLPRLPGAHFVAGATSFGFEGAVQMELKSKPSAPFCVFTSLTSLQEASVSCGAYGYMAHYWQDLGSRLAEFARRRNGLFVFVGGGDIVTKQIELMESAGIPFLVAADFPGASFDWAQKNSSSPNVFRVSVAGELAKKVKETNPLFGEENLSHRLVLVDGSEARYKEIVAGIGKSKQLLIVIDDTMRLEDRLAGVVLLQEILDGTMAAGHDGVEISLYRGGKQVASGVKKEDFLRRYGNVWKDMVSEFVESEGGEQRILEFLTAFGKEGKSLTKRFSKGGG
jgi:hypothetical protein